MEADDSITREELLRYRADTRYDPSSRLMQEVVALVASEDTPDAAKAVLRNWNGDTARDSRGAALAIITGSRAFGYEFDADEMDVQEALALTMADLQARFGRIDPEWGEVLRLVRGDLSLPLDGGPDVLRAIYADRDGVAKDGVMPAFAGDTHIMVADWAPDGTLQVDSIMQFGAATTRPGSPHYADQAPLFADGHYKRMPMTLAEVERAAVSSYRPGEAGR